MIFSCTLISLKFSLDLSGILKNYNYSGPAGWIVCHIIDAGTVIVIASYGGRACVMIHTYDRFWQIVYPVHHRKYYRRWMVKVGMVLPWLLGFVVKSVPVIATTRIVNGRCLPRTSWSSEYALRVCFYGFRSTDLFFHFPVGSLLTFDIK